MKTMTWIGQPSGVLVIVPAYNEEGSIANVVSQIREQGIGDVLVIDDGSVDRTAAKSQEAGAFVLRLPYNLGIGGAVQAGLKFAAEMEYPYVVRLDGDGQHRVDEAGKLLQVVQEGRADVAIGSRFIPDQHTYKPPLSRAMGIIWFSKMITWITRQPSYDPTSGMLALNYRAVRVLSKDYPQDYPEVEARVLLYKARLRVVEIPAKMEPRVTGSSSITYLRAIYYMFKVTLATLLASIRRFTFEQTGEF